MFREPLHGVVVSVGYDDYLDVALAHNRSFFDHCVVVTSPEDTATQRVAGKHDCELVVTADGSRTVGGFDESPLEEFNLPSPQRRTFNKGAMIERGHQQLPQGGYRLHFDADIIFPGNFRRRLEPALRDRSCLYGIDRFNVLGVDAYRKLMDAGFATRGFEYHHFLTYAPGGLPIGSRLVYGAQGWVPLGYTQIWHSDAEFSGIYRTRPYPVGSNNAAHDDVAFSLRWDREKRVLIPDVLVGHLLTGDTAYGANWNGRVTKRFDLQTPASPATPTY